MKLVLSAVLLIISVSIVRSDDEKMQKMMKVVAECKSTSGATDADIAKLLAKEDPDTKTAKCMFSCMMGHMGIIKDGKLHKDNMMGWAKTLGANNHVCEVVYDACSVLNDADECEAAAKIGVCLKNEALKHKVTLDF